MKELGKAILTTAAILVMACFCCYVVNKKNHISDIDAVRARPLADRLPPLLAVINGTDSETVSQEIRRAFDGTFLMEDAMLFVDMHSVENQLDIRCIIIWDNETRKRRNVFYADSLGKTWQTHFSFQ